MRLGVLDVGSNTVHLLVVDAHRGAHPNPMRAEKSELRLAEHLDAGHLGATGAAALVQAVARAKAAATLAGCEELLAFATSAVRDAENSVAVLERVRAETGVALQVLSVRTKPATPSSPCAAGSAGRPGGCWRSTSAAGRSSSPRAATRTPTWRCRCRWAPGG